MKRREFIKLISGVAASWPLVARAQQSAGRVYRVGYLAIGSRDQQLHLIKAFEEGLRSLGYRVGENVVIEYRFANGEMQRLPTLAEELVRLPVDIIANGSNPNTVAALKATKTIPIVMINSIDPVSAGLVASLARPGGNVTGFAEDTDGEVSDKRLQLLKEALPNLSRVGILWNPDFAPNQGRLSSMGEAAQRLGLTLVPVEARGLEALDLAFALASVIIDPAPACDVPNACPSATGRTRAAARRGRAAAVVERGCPSRCHHWRRGGTSEARRGARARAGRTSGLGTRATSGLGSPPLGLAPPPLGLAPLSLGLAPSSLAPPLLAPPLLVR